MEAPRLTNSSTYNYRLNDYPPSIRCSFEEIKNEHNLVNGGLRVYHIGFRMVCRLTWDKSVCTMTQYNLIREIVNNHTSFTLYPYPDTYPSSYFTVRILSGMSLSEWQWVSDGFMGSLEMVTTTNLSAVPQWT